MKTTLKKIYARECLCHNDWQMLLQRLGKKEADCEPLPITTIIDIMGLHCAIQCLHAVDGHTREIKLFAIWCARQVQHLMRSQRCCAVLDLADCHARDYEKINAADAAAAYALAAATAFGDNVDDYFAVYAVESAASFAQQAAADAATEADGSVDAAKAAEDADDAAAWQAADNALANAYNAATEAAKAVQEKELRRICNLEKHQ